MSRTMDASLELSSGNIAYKFRAGNPCIVLLHGLSGAKEYFDDSFHSKALEGYGILTIDIPGFGDSKVTNGDYEMSSQASRISQLLQTLNLHELYIVGHSYAGPITLLLHQLMPQKIKGIMLAESSIRPGPNSWVGSIASQSFEAYEGSYEEFTKNSYTFYEEGQVDKSKEKVQLLVDSFKKTSAEAMYNCAKELMEFCSHKDLVQEFSELNIPTCFILGSIHENNYSQNQPLKELIRRGTTLKIIENSGHCMMLDNPHHFYQSIVEFMSMN